MPVERVLKSVCQLAKKHGLPEISDMATRAKAREIMTPCVDWKECDLDRDDDEDP